MTIQSVQSDIAFGADEPFDFRRIGLPFDGLFPLPKPFQLARLFVPKRGGIGVGLFAQRIEVGDDGVSQSFLVTDRKLAPSFCRESRFCSDIIGVCDSLE